MKLTETQIQYIRGYIDAFDIKYYELKEEFLDHMILRVEEKMESSDVPFIRAVINAKDDFGPGGFKSIMKEREKNLINEYRNQYRQILRSYFKFPQIVFSILLTAAIFAGVSTLQKPVAAITIIIVTSMLLGMFQVALTIKYRKVNKQLLLQTSAFIETFGLTAIMANVAFLMNCFTDTTQPDSILLLLVYSFAGAFSFMCFLSYQKLRQQVMTNVKRLYFN